MKEFDQANTCKAEENGFCYFGYAVPLKAKSLNYKNTEIFENNDKIRIPIKMASEFPILFKELLKNKYINI